MAQKIVINPVTRVEGHGKVTIHLDDAGRVTRARFHIIEFRGFERFVQGRLYWEAPVIVQRLCGICPVSHLLAAAKAMDVVVGADHLTPTAEKMRRLMHYGQVFQSHALHFFHLASPDLLLGFESPPEARNVIGLALAHPELARRAILDEEVRAGDNPRYRREEDPGTEQSPEESTRISQWRSVTSLPPMWTP